MPRQATAKRRQRRGRGSLNPDEIMDAAFELAEQVSIDNMSMPVLATHLGVSVTSIYWYFRKKDDLLNAMTDRVRRRVVFEPARVEAGNWRESLANHARSMRKTFLSNPILCDLVLIRGALSEGARRLGVQEMEKVIASLVEAGLSPGEAFDTYSAVSLHVRGSVVLERLDQKTRALANGTRTAEQVWPIDLRTAPMMAKLSAKGRRFAAANDHNFDYGLNCILDNAGRLIEQRAKTATRRAASTARGRTKRSRPTNANGSGVRRLNAAGSR